MAELKISIVIVNYNGWQDTVECLESLLRNSYGNYQVIVVDNGSSDGSMDHLRAWAKGAEQLKAGGENRLSALSRPAVPKPVPCVCCSSDEAEKPGGPQTRAPGTQADGRAERIRYPLVFIETGSNLGFAGASNLGMRYALRGDSTHVLLLNNDTVLEREFLVELAATAGRAARAGIVGGKILYYDDPGDIWYCGGRADVIRGSGYHFRTCSGQEEFEVEFVTGCVMLIPREVIETVGMLPEEYFLTIEDLDYCICCRRAGYRLWVNPRAVIHHRVSASMCAIDSAVEVYYNTRNRLLFMLRKMGLRYVVPFCVFFAATRIVKAIGFVITGRPGHLKALCKGVMDGVRGRTGQLR